MKIHIYKESQYWLLFDEKKGIQYRIGFKENASYNCQGPELLDIAITNYCEKNCTFCYRKSSITGKHMPIIMYEKLLKQAMECGVMQIALGGGNPNQHPQFVDILRLTRKYGIIPTYTTNGHGMTDEIYRVTKEVCGAMAVSYYQPLEYLKQVVRKCKENNIKLNVHFVLGKESIEQAIILLTNPPAWVKDVNAIIFLNYKPVRGDIEACLNRSELLDDFWTAVLKFEACKIGFDSCMISFIDSISEKAIIESIDYCEASRFSAFINEEGMMFPCSFMNDLNYIEDYDLSEDTIKNVWRNGATFAGFRECLFSKEDKKCLTCSWFNNCHGGCKLFPINKCEVT